MVYLSACFHSYLFHVSWFSKYKFCTLLVNFVSVCFILFGEEVLILRIEPRVLCMAMKCATTEQYFQLSVLF